MAQATCSTNLPKMTIVSLCAIESQNKELDLRISLQSNMHTKTR
jgi:hypothetical protein